MTLPYRFERRSEQLSYISTVRLGKLGKILQTKIAVAKKSHRILQDVLVPFFSGEPASIIPEAFVSPSEMYHIIMRCKPRYEYLKIRPRPESYSSEQPPPELRAGSVLTRLKKKIFGRVSENIPQPADRIGFSEALAIKYFKDDFQAFDSCMPETGLAAGKGAGIHWLKPLFVEIKDLGYNACNWKNIFIQNGIDSGCIHKAGDNGWSPIEIKFVFKVILRDGSHGEACFIDRVDTRGNLKRIHVYPNGCTDSSDKYQEDKFRHDILRTLMAQVLLGELYPALNKSLKAQSSKVGSDFGNSENSIFDKEINQKVIRLLSRKREERLDNKEKKISIVRRAV